MNSVQKGSFLRHAVTLSSGTALAQIVPLLITPLLTRLYSPDAYGVMAIFMSASILGTVIATLRFEHAILLPECSGDAAKAVYLVLIVSTLAAGAAAALFLGFHSSLIRASKIERISNLLYLAPVSIALGGWTTALTYWSNRNQEYGLLAKSRIVGSCMTATVSISLGFLLEGRPIGLVSAFLIGQISSFACLAYSTFPQLRKVLPSCRMRALAEHARFYARFPMFSLPADLTNSLAQQLPNFVLARFFGETVLGHFALGLRLLGMPIQLVSSAICEVFKKRAADEIRISGECLRMFDKTFLVLVGIGALPFSMLFLAAPWAFRLVFGADWEVAGTYTRYLTVLYFLRFSVSPLTYILYIREKQNIDLIGQLTLLAVVSASMAIGVLLRDPGMAIICYSVGYSLTYVGYFFVSRSLAGACIRPHKWASTIPG